MHRALAAWLTAELWRAVVVTAVLALVAPQGLSPIGVVAGAVPVLALLARNAQAGFLAAGAGVFVATATLLAIGQSPSAVGAFVFFLFVAPLILAWILQRTGSLPWIFQVAVLAACGVLVAIYVAFDDAAGAWNRLVREFVHQVSQSGLRFDEAALLQSLSTSNWGTLIAIWLLTVLGSLFLGAWWQSLLVAPGAFGREFREIRLGRLLSGAAVATILGAFFLDSGVLAQLLAALSWVATIALACQGLAAVHRLKASGRIGRGWLTAAYLLLIVPLTMLFMVLLLAGWGVADNWRRRA